MQHWRHGRIGEMASACLCRHLTLDANELVCKGKTAALLVLLHKAQGAH